MESGCIGRASEYSMQTTETVPQVVIIGAGFAGLYAARSCAKAELGVTLVDRRNHHTFQPLLYQVATAALSPAEIAYPIRHIFKDDRNISVLLARATDFDLEHRKVQLDGDELPTTTSSSLLGPLMPILGTQSGPPMPPD